MDNEMKRLVAIFENTQAEDLTNKFAEGGLLCFGSGTTLALTSKDLRGSSTLRLAGAAELEAPQPFASSPTLEQSTSEVDHHHL